MLNQIDQWQENKKHEDYLNVKEDLIHRKNNSIEHDLLIVI